MSGFTEMGIHVYDRDEKTKYSEMIKQVFCQSN